MELSRPPGWKPLYGTFKKPVYKPTENKVFNSELESVYKSKKFVDIDFKLPELGTNEKHISVHMYTLKKNNDNTFKKNNDKTLVVDVYISNFKNWTPEPKGSYDYPEKALVENGPYYMTLADNLNSIFKIIAENFTLVEYIECEDKAIYSGEISNFTNYY